MVDALGIAEFVTTLVITLDQRRVDGVWSAPLA